MPDLMAKIELIKYLFLLTMLVVNYVLIRWKMNRLFRLMDKMMNAHQREKEEYLRIMQVQEDFLREVVGKELEKMVQK